MGAILNPDLLDGSDALARRFNAAEPFRHVVIDGLFAPEIGARLAREFPAAAGAGAGVREFGEAFRALDDALGSPEVAAFWSRVTGIAGLLHDPGYEGGGAVIERAGREPPPHLEVERHSREKWHRRLHLRVWLDENWDGAWGGGLELHADPRRPDEDRVVRVAPGFNRAVLFEVSDRSWIGTRALAPGRESRALSIYFYVPEYAVRRRAGEQGAIYVERPLPLSFSAGGEVTGDGLAAVKGLIARRRQHLARVMRREERILDDAQQRVEALLDGARGRFDARAVDATRWLVARLDEHLSFIYDRELVLASALAGEQPDFSRGISVMGVLRDADGLYDDSWASGQLRFRFSVAMPIAEVRLRGRVPDQLDGQELRLTLGRLLVDRRFAAGEFEWVVPFSAGVSTQIAVQIVAARSWSPKRAGQSDDIRELAWRLEDVIVS